MLLFDVLFRPVLMVVGFFASFMLIDASMSFVGKMFVMFISGMEVGHFAGLITFVAVGVIASILIVTLIHKVFSLITWIPDNVLRWVGQQTQSLGESQDESNVRGGFVAAIGRGQSSAGGALSYKQRQANVDANEQQNKLLGSGDGPSDSGSAPAPGNEEM